MLRRTHELDAPRRVVALHLLFGVATVALLTVGTVQVVLSISSARADTTALSAIGKVSTQIRADHRASQGSRYQQIVEEFSHQFGVNHLALINAEHTYLAHSSPAQVGQPAVEAAGKLGQWGDVERLYPADSASPLAIYRAPLREGDQIFVTVEVGIPKGSFWHKIASASEHGLLFILIGLVACGVGSSFLWMVLKPLASIERQLRAAATDNVAEMPLQTVPATSLAAIGWNRMLDEMTRRTSGGNLQERVATGLRSHREKRAEAILKSLTDGVALTDHEDRITFVNSALLGILNLTDDALLGRTMDEFFQFAAGAGPSRKFLDSQFRAQQVIAEVGRNGDMAAGVLRIARVPLVTQGQEGALNHVWMIRDVTQQKLADQMRNQFVYSATHELRTPLANIKAYAETLAETRFSDIEKQKQFCNTINVEATRLSRFIDDLLSISRMETGAMSLQKYETDVARLLDEVVDKVRPEMDAKRIAFNTLLPPKLPKLMLDKDKINVTLVNLLGNAAKYTPEGGNVSLEVEWANDLLQIHVVDSGIGIAQQDLAKVFDKFYRSNDPRVQDRTGSGLGLSIAQEIVRLHGGKIAVHSELDKGSKFTVVLPTR